MERTASAHVWERVVNAVRGFALSPSFYAVGGVGVVTLVYAGALRHRALPPNALARGKELVNRVLRTVDAVDWPWWARRAMRVTSCGIQCGSWALLWLCSAHVLLDSTKCAHDKIEHLCLLTMGSSLTVEAAKLLIPKPDLPPTLTAAQAAVGCLWGVGCHRAWVSHGAPYDRTVGLYILTSVCALGWANLNVLECKSRNPNVSTTAQFSTKGLLAAAVLGTIMSSMTTGLNLIQGASRGGQ